MSKFLADECVNTDVVLSLREAGVDVLTVGEVGLIGSDDDIIFRFACEKKRTLLSFDRGFGDIFRFNINKSFGVIIVMVGQMKKREIINIILGFLSVIEKGISLRSKLAILGKTKIRIINR